MFNKLMRDNIKIEKKNGEEIDNLKAYVSSRSIIIMRSDISIEANDVVKRLLPNGEIENYEVLNPGFSKGFCNIPPHYNIGFKKLDSSKIWKRKRARISFSNNILKTKSLINISGNLFIANQLTSLREEVDKINLDLKDKNDALRTVEEISLNLKSNNPSEEVIESLFNSLPHERSITSIRTFLLGCFK